MSNTNSLALIIFSLLAFFFLGRPMFSEMQNLRTEVKSYKQEIEKINTLESRKNELLAKLNQIPLEDRDRVSSFLPSADEVVRLVSNLDALALKQGIDLTQVNFGPEKYDRARAVSDTVAPEVYNSRIITLSFSANYSNLQAFLKNVEQSLRMVDIRSVDVSSEADKGGLYQYKVSAEVYWLAEQIVKNE